MNEGVSQIPAPGAGRAPAQAGGRGIDPATGMVGNVGVSEPVGAWGVHVGAATQHVDGVVVLFWTFAVFFGALVWYLRAEDKREGYPLEDPTVPERGGRPVGFPPPPAPKTYNLLRGATATLPRPNSPPDVPGRHLHPFPGSSLVPTGANPMLDPIGPASYCLREDEPLLMEGDEVQILPLREAGEEWRVQGGDADPRGMPVVARDGAVAGHVRDLWVDKEVKLLRYLEVEVAGGGRRLMPIFYADVSPKFGRVRTRAIHAEQFTAIPALRDPNRVSAREEDRICAYFAGGKLFADGVRRGAYGQARPGAGHGGLRGLFRRRTA